ncbi:MAG TPA: PKD domain-containing protein, partial [Bacteroidia bacterium]|nr:PKD domain-containing protein [Bacteroidia bacterium]
TGTATAAGGNGVLTYLWSPSGQTNPTATNLGSGTHSVTVTDANGCTITGSVAVTSPAPITLTLSSTPTSCNLDNGTATVAASGGALPYTYNWSPGGQNTPTAINLASGGYSVTVTDAAGCSSTGSVTVSGSNGVQANTVGTPSFCEGEGGDTLLVVGSGGALPYYYNWWCQSTMGPCGLDSTFDDDPLANPNVSGWYYVQITDGNGCLSNIDSVFLTILPKPIVDAGADLILCGDSAPCQILNPTVTGAPGPYTYQWIPSTGLNDPNIANPCARPDTTTIYALVVGAGNGCSSDFTTTDTLSTVVVNVNPVPVADAGPDQHICFGDSAELEGIGTNAGPAYTYQWSPTTGLASPTSRVTMASPPLTTTYTLVAFSNGCPSYGDDITLFVHTIPTTDAGPDREMCLGDSILIDASAGGDSTASYSFVWTPNANIDNANSEDPTVWPVSTTTYYVEAISNYGCGSSRDSVLVTLLPTPIANAGDNATICEGTTFQFQGSFSYTTTNPANPSNVFQFWTPGGGMSDPNSLTPTASPTTSGLYTLTVYTGLCQTQDSMLLTVIPDLELAVAADTNVICEGDSVWIEATSAVSSVIYLWSPAAGMANPNAAGTHVSPGDSTVYTVIANGAGCQDTASLAISVIPRPNVAFLNSQPQGCAPLSVNFLQDVSDALFFTWNFGDGSPVSNQFNPLHVYAEPGTYTVTLTAVNIGGCETEFQGETVVVSDTSRVDFTS